MMNSENEKIEFRRMVESPMVVLIQGPTCICSVCSDAGEVLGDLAAYGQDQEPHARERYLALLENPVNWVKDSEEQLFMCMFSHKNGEVIRVVIQVV